MWREINATQFSVDGIPLGTVEQTAARNRTARALQFGVPVQPSTAEDDSLRLSLSGGVRVATNPPDILTVSSTSSTDATPTTPTTQPTSETFSSKDLEDDTGDETMGDHSLDVGVHLDIAPASGTYGAFPANANECVTGGRMDISVVPNCEFGNTSRSLVAIRETPVPTVLRDSDAPPYFDDPGEEDLLNRALKDADYEGDEIFVGRIFKNKEDCTIKMAIHAIRRKFHFVTSKSSTMKVLAVCVSHTCPCRVFAHKMDDSDRLEIRSITLQHTCSVDARGDFHKQATTTVIGSLMKTRYAGVGRGPRPNERRHILCQEFSLNVSYWKAWRAREIVMDNAMGSAIGSFALVQPYIKLLLQTNPNSKVALETKLDSNGVDRFKYLFLSLHASIQGYAYMRKVIIIDGMHLRGIYGGCLIAASAQDANFQVFPLAFAIVNSENDDAWTWFLQKLTDIMPDEADMVFVSDRHSSIYSSIRQ
ncbi:PREDICTED: uncharacterized protein LOC109131609, partial [Camelina sativa]|uniref:Uncharacterized protein LOC109131609 n=1 Tax=Camelina sativa TaxID=90675 RepID=A0ABM1RH36_CAMSA